MKHSRIRLFAILLAITLCCSACSSLLSQFTKAADESTAAGTAASTADSSAVSTESTKAAESEHETDPAPTEPNGGDTETNDCLTLRLDSTSEFYFSDKVQSLVVNVKNTFPVLSEESAAALPALKTALEAYALTLTADSQTAFAGLKEQADANLQMAAGLGGYHSYGWVGITRADSLVFSLIHSEESFSGGMRPTTGLSSLNLNSQTGKALTLKEVLTDSSVLPGQLVTALKAAYPGVDWSSYSLPAVISKLVSEDSLIWTLGYEAVSFYFAAGEIAPVAEGDFTVSLDFASHKNDIAEIWRSVPAAYMQSFVTLNDYGCLLAGTSYGDLVFDFSGDGYVTTHYNLQSETGSLSMDCDFTAAQAYRMHTADGRDYIYLSEQGYGDDQALRIIGLSSQKAPSELAELYYGMETPLRTTSGTGMTAYLTSPESFPLTQRTDRFGSCKTTRSYRIGASGLPESDAEWSTVISPVTVTLKSSLKVSLSDASTGEIIGTVNLSAGEKLSAAAIRGNDVRLSLSDGRSVTVTVEKNTNTYEYGINGALLSELFDGIVYAD